MNLLQKLTFLMEKNGDTVASLSRKSGIPYTTIDGLYKKGYANIRLTTLQKICETYGVTLDYLARDYITDPTYGLYDPSPTRLPTSADEERLLTLWRNADDTIRPVVLELLELHPRPDAKKGRGVILSLFPCLFVLFAFSR